jgi:hypothetical protein
VTAEKLAHFLGIHGEGDAWDFNLTFDLADKRMCAELARAYEPAVPTITTVIVAKAIGNTPNATTRTPEGRVFPTLPRSPMLGRSISYKSASIDPSKSSSPSTPFGRLAIEAPWRCRRGAFFFSFSREAAINTKTKQPSPEVIARIDREWPGLRAALVVIAAKNAPAREAEDIVSQSYRGIRSGARAWDPEKEPDFAVFAGLVVLSNARNWREISFNKRRDRGAFDETSQRRVASLGASPEAIAIAKEEFARAFETAFSKGTLEHALFELVKRGVTNPVAQAKALDVGVERIRQLVARIHAVCGGIIQKGQS